MRKTIFLNYPLWKRSKETRIQERMLNEKPILNSGSYWHKRNSEKFVDFADLRFLPYGRFPFCRNSSATSAADSSPSLKLLCGSPETARCRDDVRPPPILKIQP